MKCGSAGTAFRVEGTAEGKAWVRTRSAYFQTARRPERPGTGEGVSGGTRAGPGRHGAEGFPCDGSPLEGGAAPVGTRCAFACDAPCPADSRCQAQPSPSLTRTSGLCVQYGLF